MKESRFENFLTSWKFFLLLVLLQFLLMPVATKGFKFEAAGDLIFYTLRHAFIMDMYAYTVYFQIVMIFYGDCRVFLSAVCRDTEYGCDRTVRFQHGDGECGDDGICGICLALVCVEG